MPHGETESLKLYQIRLQGTLIDRLIGSVIAPGFTGRGADRGRLRLRRRLGMVAERLFGWGVRCLDRPARFGGVLQQPARGSGGRKFRSRARGRRDRRAAQPDTARSFDGDVVRARPESDHEGPCHDHADGTEPRKDLPGRRGDRPRRPLLRALVPRYGFPYVPMSTSRRSATRGSTSRTARPG